VNSYMAVVSKNHNGHSVRQRIVVTLICLTLATTLVSSISLYVDSATVDEWNHQIEIGPVSMMVSGDGVNDVLDEIAPLFVANSLIASINAYASWSFLFPVPMFVIVPGITLIIVLSFYLICMLALITIIAKLSTRIELRKALSSSWTKGGPFVESEN